MKKFLIFLIAVVTATYILGGYLPSMASDEIHPPPPLCVTIRGEEALAEMREMAVADEKNLIDYLLRTYYIVNGLKNREDVVTFLELLDSLPLPVLPDAKLNVVEYYIEIPIIVICYEAVDGGICAFRYVLNSRPRCLHHHTKRNQSPKILLKYFKFFKICAIIEYGGKVDVT